MIDEPEDEPMPSPDDEELLTDVSISSRDYPWTDDPDEQRRCFVFQQMGSADIDGHVLISNMQRICEWLKTGAVPKAPPPRKNVALKVVDK